MSMSENYTVVKCNVRNDELNEYLKQMSILSNNLTNTLIYHHRQWYFYTQNVYYTEHPKENFKPYQYNSDLINELKKYMYEYNQNKIKRGKQPNDFIAFGLDAFFVQYYLKKIEQPDYIHDGLSAQIAQQITSKVSQTFKAFRQAKKDYFKHPDKYDACPQLPRYNKKGGASNLYFTNQASAVDLDELPVYGDDVPVGSFSGRRYGIRDRLYETANGTTVNADMNGALNILRKAFPEIEIELTDLQYMKNPRVLRNMQA